MTLLAATQAVDLRGGPARLGAGSLGIYDAVRRVSPFLECNRPLEGDVAAVAAQIQTGRVSEPIFSWRKRGTNLPLERRARGGLPGSYVSMRLIYSFAPEP